MIHLQKLMLCDVKTVDSLLKRACGYGDDYYYHELQESKCKTEEEKKEFNRARDRSRNAYEFFKREIEEKIKNDEIKILEMNISLT